MFLECLLADGGLPRNTGDHLFKRHRHSFVQPERQRQVTHKRMSELMRDDALQLASSS